MGSELFIIDGDSLLLECFSNEKLDFCPGFQLLHATYIVEKFLQKLKQRKCVFEIVFFDTNAQFCIPARSSNGNNNRYLLARETIIQHLIAVSPEKHELNVYVFETFRSQAFEEHLLDSGTYVFMCHDGAMEEINKVDEASDDNDDSSGDNYQEDEDHDISFENESESIQLGPSSSFINLRLMIRWFIMHGCNIALINNLEFRDTKVGF